MGSFPNESFSLLGLVRKFVRGVHFGGPEYRKKDELFVNEAFFAEIAGQKPKLKIFRIIFPNFRTIFEKFTFFQRITEITSKVYKTPLLSFG